MSSDLEPDHDADPSYAYRPSLLGAPSSFTLRRDGLHWQIGRRTGVIRYDRVRSVRMSFRPMTMQSHRFLTEIRSPDSPKLQIASSSWRSMVEQERLDRDYTAFVTELHRRLAAAGGATQFLAGMPAVTYWIGAVLFAGIMLAMAVLTVRALQAGQWAGAAILAVFFGVFAFQLGSYFRRNRPERYRPDALPRAVLPRT